jgi:hypothetical protein
LGANLGNCRQLAGAIRFAIAPYGYRSRRIAAFIDARCRSALGREPFQLPSAMRFAIAPYWKIRPQTGSYKYGENSQASASLVRTGNERPSSSSRVIFRERRWIDSV